MNDNQMKVIEYMLKRSQCLHIMSSGVDSETIKKAIFVIMKEKEFQTVLDRWIEISKNLTDIELEEICKYIRDLYLYREPAVHNCENKTPFEKSKDYTIKIVEKLRERGVNIDFEIMWPIYFLARQLERTQPV